MWLSLLVWAAAQAAWADSGLRPALKRDYERWLDGYIRKGGRVTQYRHAPWSSQARCWYTAQGASARVPPACVGLFRAVVPKGLDFRLEGAEYDVLYFENQYLLLGEDVPAFADTQVSPASSAELARAKQRALAEQARFREQSRQRRSWSERGSWLFREKTLPLLRDGVLKDYADWLDGYRRRGGVPTHRYEDVEETIGGRIFVALEDFWIYPLYGVSSVMIVVPPQVRFLGGDRGDSSLYFMEGFRPLGGHVPAYD